MSGRPTVAWIDASALRANLAAIRRGVASNVAIMAVVKADGYGHDSTLVASALAAAGVSHFGVATVDEAIALRGAGIAHPILVLAGAAPDSVETLLEHNLSVAVIDAHMARRLAEVVEVRRLSVHLKIDTGMSRLGVAPRDLQELIAVLSRAPALVVDGVFSHLGDADDCDTPFADAQLALFKEASAILERAGIRPRWRHLANSVATLTRPDMHFDMVRPGIALYGVTPAAATGIALQPAMALRTRIWQLKSVPAECAVSYGQTFVTRRPTRIAVLPIGYADGYGRALSNRGQVLVRGQRAPIIGRVCMDLTLVDVTDIPGVEPDDEVVLWGRHGGAMLTVEEVGAWQDTIGYEVLTRLGKRIPRRLVQGDKQ